MEEKRQYKRTDTPYTTLYCHFKGAYSVFLKDISQSGAAIVFKNKIKINVNEKATIHFYARGINKLIAKVECTVVRIFKDSGRDAVGVKFDSTNKQVKDVIEFLELEEENNEA